MPADTPRDCVCLASGHCHACLDADRRCERPDCRATCADGHACGRPPEVSPAEKAIRALRETCLDDATISIWVDQPREWLPTLLPAWLSVSRARKHATRILILCDLIDAEGDRP